MSASNKPKIGDITVRDGKVYRVVSVWPKMTPFKKKNQDTYVEGWCVGLREVKGSGTSWCN